MNYKNLLGALGVLLCAFSSHAQSHDLSDDFSLNSNPNGVWSYGRQDTLGGVFTLLGTAKTNVAGNGVPIQVWAISPVSQPVVLHNATTNTAITDGGQGNFPPGVTWFGPGIQGQPGNYCVIRFTAPPGGAGSYNLATIVWPALDGSIQGDADFHVLRNGVELLGQQLPPGASIGYTNTIFLSTGDTIDFAIGRGADNNHNGSGLKIEATLGLVSTNLPPAGSSFVIPRTVETNNAPFGSGTFTEVHRSQQVYGSAEFPPYPILIHELRFRPDSTFGGPFSTTVSNIQINLSTTLRNPNALSLTFAENVGADDMIVFQGPLSVSSQFIGPAGSPKNFDIIVPLAQPYLYNPTNGNLVVDTRNFSGPAARKLSGQGGPDVAGRVLGGVAASSGGSDSGADAIQLVFSRLPPSRFDLSGDFSLASNPNGVWSYGWEDSLGGAFTLLGTAKTNLAGNGVPIQLWAINPVSQPAVLHNATTNTAITDGGQGNYPPGTTWFVPGVRGNPGNFGVIRFTVPGGGAGSYALSTWVWPSLDGSSHGDTDFHVLRNGIELFGQQLPAGGSTSYTNEVSLFPGDTIDFAIGRGADNSHVGSGLKIGATLELVSTNPPPPSPLLLVVPSGYQPREGAGGTRSLSDAARVQEVYGSTNFPPTVLRITELRFRPSTDFATGAFSNAVSNIVVRLSTTTRSPDNLSRTFADNVGVDETVVYSGALPVQSQFMGPSVGPKNFDIIVPLQRPFTYVPADGNLLLDIQTLRGASYSFVLDAASGQDGASRAISLDPNSPTAATVDSAADIVQIVYLSLPRSVAPARDSAGNFSFTFNSDTNRNYVVEASTNLFNWVVVTNVANTSGMVQIFDSTAYLFPQRFYRTRVAQ